MTEIKYTFLAIPVNEKGVDLQRGQLFSDSYS